MLHDECHRIFRRDKDKQDSTNVGIPLRLHRHQTEAIQTAREGHHHVLTTGTESGQSLTYIVPIVDHVLRCGSGRGIQALIVYPMNALANSQCSELEKFLCHGYPKQDKQRVIATPPDILLTNYVMLELLTHAATGKQPQPRAAQGLQFLVLDELHTYRGWQGADVALLIRRVRDACAAAHLSEVSKAPVNQAIVFWQRQRKTADLQALIGGGSRYDLDGNQQGEVTPEQQERAREELVAWRANRQEKRRTTFQLHRPATTREDDPGSKEARVRLGTMKRIKGIEFRAVAVACADSSDPINHLTDADIRDRCDSCTRVFACCCC